MDAQALDVKGRRKTTTPLDMDILLGRGPVEGAPLAAVPENNSPDRPAAATAGTAAVTAAEEERLLDPSRRSVEGVSLDRRSLSYAAAVGEGSANGVSSAAVLNQITPADDVAVADFWSTVPGYTRLKRRGLIVHPVDRGLCGPITFWERISFNWVSPLLERAQTTILGPDDMAPIPARDEAALLTDQLEAAWAAELAKGPEKASMVWAYYSTFKSRFWKVCLWHALESSVLILQSWLLGQLILSIDDESSDEVIYGYATGLILSFFATATVLHHLAFMEAWRFAQVCMTATLGAVYRKSLRLRQQDMASVSTGFIINLITNDAERFLQACIFGPFVVIGPVMLLAATLLVWEVVGWPAFCGCAFLTVTIPIYIFISRRLKNLRGRIAGITDRRVKTMSEVLGGMRVLKMNGWISPFRDLIWQIRMDEIHYLRQVAYIKGFQFGLNFATPTILAAAVFLPYVLVADGELNERVVFTTMALFNAVRFIVGMCVPFALQSIAEMKVVFGRIQKLLSMTDSGSDFIGEGAKAHSPITFEHVALQWSPDSDAVLKDATFKIELGELIMVVGPVGSGKSAMLMAILNELVPVEGKVRVHGTLAYAPQEPWILSDTIRENILFGEPFRAADYAEVVKICQLERDLEILERGDQTFVGERGVTLSGGQRARIGLARAVYSGFDTFLLDDPLSAVDAKVGSHMFDECICGPRLAKKTRVLVTHQLQFAPRADRIIVLGKDHTIVGCGNYGELVAQGIDLSGIVLQGDDPTSPTPQADDVVADPVTKAKEERADKNAKDATNAPANRKAEGRKSGVVTSKTYLDYARAGCGSSFAALLLVLLMISAQVSDMMTNWWLARWADMDPTEQDDAEPREVYGGLLASTTALSFLRCGMFMFMAIQAAKALHNRSLAAVMKTPIHFFDTTPVGTILNKFSKDLGYVDDLLPMTFFDFSAGAITVIGIVLLASILNPYIFLISAPLTVVFFKLRKYYLKASREIKRVEAVQRSPKYGLVSSSLVGLATIRSRVGARKRFCTDMSKLQNEHSKAYLSFILTSRWLGFRLDLISAVFVTAVTLIGVYLRDELGSSNIGLSLVYCFQLSGLFQWIVRQSAEVENQMISVERIMGLSNLRQEKDDGEAPVAVWPSSGRIEFKNVTMRYSDELPLVLKGLSFVIEDGEKIGIVGRTGAGKSSLMEVLFRLSPHGGAIILDGVDTNDLTLDTLRSSVSVIPQEPLLFSGTIRFNVDPFNDFSDDRIRNALSDVQLVDSLANGLETVVAENGSNFSVGQRQLICLARALLRPNRFLILDEATANIDPVTDAIIQDVISERFGGWTVLTIAHRLNTVISSDRILVLDQGQVVEFAPPAVLRGRRGSVFADLARHSQGR